MGKNTTKNAQKGMLVAQQKTKSVWEQGRAQIQSVHASDAVGAWKGSVRTTLGAFAGQETWRDVEIHSAEEINIAPRGEHTGVFDVASGERLRWAFRVKEHSIGFAVRT